MKRKGGYTLIELIVVVAIIALLAAMSVLAFSRQQAKSRDTKRKADLSNINTALQNYVSENIEPLATTQYTDGRDRGAWDYSSQTGGNFTGDNAVFVPFLESYLGGKAPRDPINDASTDISVPSANKQYAYGYYYYASPSASSPISGYTYYSLLARLEIDFEKYEMKIPVRPK